MDRRRALQALAGGSLGAGVIIQSSPAFAYDSPTVTGTLNASITTQAGNTRATVALTYTSATCPASAVSTTTARTLTLTKIFTGTRAVFTISPTPSVEVTSSGTVIATAPTSVVIEKRNENSGVPVNWFAGNGSNNNRIRVQIAETYTCTYSDMTQRTATRTYDRTFVYQSGGAWT